MNGSVIIYSANVSRIEGSKGPRERVISAKLPGKKEKLPPPPFGKTMGHGII